jgi:hypothetical protein
MSILFPALCMASTHAFEPNAGLGFKTVEAKSVGAPVDGRKNAQIKSV